MPPKLTVPPVRESEVLDVEVGKQQFRVVIDRGTADGVPLLLMNGIGARLELLQPLVDELSPTRTVIRFDAPGVGSSATASRPYRFRRLAKQVAAVLDQLGYDQVDVLGISWGGGLAQQFAWSQAQRCRRLVLVSTATGAIMIPAHPKILAKMITHRRYTDPDYLEEVAHELYGGTMRDDPAAALAALRAKGTSHNTTGYVMQLSAGLGWTSVAFLPLIKAPTLVMSGNDDPLIPACNAKLMASLIPNSQLDIFRGGHLGVVTEADEQAPKIERFLDDVEFSANHPSLND
jgi:poly(3-hydroxyalkanoate) depolymerase